MSKKSMKQYKEKFATPKKEAKKNNRKVAEWVLAILIIIWTLGTVFGTIAFFKTTKASAEAVEQSTAYTVMERNASIDPFMPAVECDLDFFSGIWFRHGGTYRVNMVQFPWTLRAESTLRYLVFNNTTEIDITPVNGAAGSFNDFFFRYVDLRAVTTPQLSSLTMQVQPDRDFAGFSQIAKSMPYACDITFLSGYTDMVVIKFTIYEIGTVEGYEYNISYDTGIVLYDCNFADNTFFLPEYGPAVADTPYNYPLYCATVKDYPFEGSVVFGDIYGEGYYKGYDAGEEVGYKNGEQVGYDSGYAEGDSVGYNRGYDAGYNIGNADGFTDGVASANEYSFAGLLGAVFDVPVQTFQGLFNFEILGINLSGFLLALLTLMIILAITKLFI